MGGKQKGKEGEKKRKEGRVNYGVLRVIRRHRACPTRCISSRGGRERSDACSSPAIRAAGSLPRSLCLGI